MNLARLFHRRWRAEFAMLEHRISGGVRSTMTPRGPPITSTRPTWNLLPASILAALASMKRISLNFDRWGER